MALTVGDKFPELTFSIQQGVNAEVIQTAARVAAVMTAIATVHATAV